MCYCIDAGLCLQGVKSLRQGLLGLFSILFCFFATEVEAAPVQGSMSFQGDTVHAEFEGRPTWVYEIKKIAKGPKTFMQLSVDSMDEKSAKAFADFKSDFVRSVTVDSKGPDGKSVVWFELANEGVESFDYLTDQPSRLIVDFYVTEKSKKAAKKATTAAASPKSKAKSKVSEEKMEIGRQPAAADALVMADQGRAASVGAGAGVRSGIFDGGDPEFERFSVKDYEVKEDAILRSKENYYIPFPMLLSPNESFDQVRRAAPVYQITPKDDEENKMARLLLTLFERKRFAVYLKTLGWFKEKYPDSSYNEILAYMTGDVHFNRWQEKKNVEDYELASQAYRAAVEKYPTSPSAERTSLLIGLMALDRGDTLSAVRLLEHHIQNEKFGNKDVFSKDLARLAMGFGYTKLFRTEEALKAFDEVEKKSSFKDLKIEAAYRKGDVLTAAKQYVRAIEEYQKALKNMPEGRERFPGATFNQAEAMFLTGSYRPSLDVFRDFVKRFPSDEHAPFAMTRLGELLEVLGADPTRVVGAYLETYFRYGENPSAIVARLRLLSTRMKGMKPKEADNAVKEILSLAKKSDLPNVEQFATVLIADGYTSRDEYQKAIDLLTKYYQENPTSPDLEPMKRRIVSNIAAKFRSEVDAGQFITALKTHQKYADGWLKNADRMDVQFNLGRAFEMAGVPQEAQKRYQEVLNRIHAVKGTPAEKSLNVLQHLPSEEAVNLRLAEAATRLQNYQAAYDQLRLIKSPEKLPENEQIERVSLAVKLLEKRGDLESAVRYLSELLKTWQGKPELVAAPYADLARLEIKQGQKKDAMESLKKIDVLMKDSNAVAPKIHMQALENLADLYLETKQPEKAAETFSDLLRQYEEKNPLASIRYRLGRLFFDRGEVQKAAEIWNEFKGEKVEFWQKLAQEQLKNSDWRDDYKKYIKRIPAMVDEKKKE